MRRKLLVIGAVCMLGLSGCGNTEVKEYDPAVTEQSTASTTESTTTEEQTSEDVSSEDTESTEVTTEAKEETGFFATDMNNNIAADVVLSTITIDGVDKSIPCSVESTGLTRCSYANSSIETSYQFKGWGYGIQKDAEDPMSFGNLIFFETNESGAQVLAARITSGFYESDAPSIEIAGIGVGMSEADVLARYGEGKEHSGNYFYKNSSGVLVVEYENEKVESVTYIPE